MKFSDFVTRVLNQLRENYNWRGAWKMVGDHLDILDLIQTEYSEECDSQMDVNAVPDWTARVESTALECDRTI